MSTLQEVKEFQKRERAKHKSGRVHVAPKFKKRNTERAGRGAYLVATYTLQTQCWTGSDEENMTDILTDLMHMADRDGIDFAAALRMATTHHTAEA